MKTIPQQSESVLRKREAKLTALIDPITDKFIELGYSHYTLPQLTASALHPGALSPEMVELVNVSNTYWQERAAIIGELRARMEYSGTGRKIKSRVFA